MINWTGVSPKNGKLELKELTPEMLEALVSPENLDVKGDNITIGFIDLECNGLEYTTDEVIEIGIKSYLVNRKTGRLGKLVDEYNGLQEIEEPLKQKVINITGIPSHRMPKLKSNHQIAIILSQVAVRILFGQSAVTAESFGTQRPRQKPPQRQQ